MAVTMREGGGTTVNPLDALSRAQTDDEKYEVLTTMFGLSPEQARENIAALGQGRPAVNTSSPTGMWEGVVSEGNPATAPLAVVKDGLKQAFTPDQIANMSPETLATQLGYSSAGAMTTNPVTGAVIKAPPAASIGGAVPTPVVPKQTSTPFPEMKPFQFSSSFSTDPEQARQQAGLRAYNQVSPQILAKQQEQQLAFQGLEMLRQQLRQGVQQATDETLRGVPKLTDQMRRLRSTMGLGESGFVTAGQKEIQADALRTIANRAAQSSLTEEQAAQRVMLEQLQRNQEISALLGLVSTDEQGRFVGTLVDQLTEEILDKNRQLGMQERSLSLQEYQLVNSLALDAWRAQEAIRQGDEQLALQHQQMAQENARALEQLQLQKDQFGFDQQKWAEGAEGRDLAVEQARTSLDQLKQLFPVQLEREKTALDQQNQLFPLEMDLLQQKVAAGELQATLDDLKLQEAQLINTLMNDKDLGRRAQAVEELQYNKTRTQLIEAQIEQVQATTAKMLRGPETEDYTLKYGPAANLLIQQGRQAEVSGDSARANELYNQAMAEAQKWSQGLDAPQGQAKIDPYTMQNLNRFGVSDIGLTQNPQAFLDNVRDAMAAIETGMTARELMQDFESEYREKLAKSGVDPNAFKAWLEGQMLSTPGEIPASDALQTEIDTLRSEEVRLMQLAQSAKSLNARAQAIQDLESVRARLQLLQLLEGRRR